MTYGMFGVSCYIVCNRCIVLTFPPTKFACCVGCFLIFELSCGRTLLPILGDLDNDEEDLDFLIFFALSFDLVCRL